MKITWLPESLVRLPARLGVSHIPGRSRMPGATKVDLDALSQQGVTYLISLVEAKEYLTMDPPETLAQRKQAVEQRGMGFYHQSIVDFDSPTREQAKDLVRSIEEQLRREKHVVVHCWAGLGRAGTILACYLVHKGFTPREAIGDIRYLRPFAIQSKEQVKFIHAFANS